jgi:hypothetical protein
MKVSEGRCLKEWRKLTNEDDSLIINFIDKMTVLFRIQLL